MTRQWKNFLSYLAGVVALMATVAHAAPLSGKAETVEFNRVVWEKSPLHIVLPVGTQRQVHFDGWQDFKLDAPDILARESVLSTTILNGVVYWTARKDFPEQLVLAKDESS
ncbi:MAG: hypothetical protein OEW08_14165, partial [Gammaproteobacteria bacterium]|nr:hypothetical protein [Gammaproteobacteria bacterium]